MQNVECKLQIANCKLQIADCGVQDCGGFTTLHSSFCILHSAICNLHSAFSIPRGPLAHAHCGSVASPPSRRRRRGRRGFSLLEVILAIAILTGALAVLGELARQGIESTRIARDTSRALLLCENKLAEITSWCGFPEQMYDVPCEEAADGSLLGLQTRRPPWLYSVELASVDLPGLVAVRVSVYQDLPPETEPVECSLVRWIVDPGVEFYVPEEEASQSETPQPTE